MKYITVDQFEGASFIDVYVMDDRIRESLIYSISTFKELKV